MSLNNAMPTGKHSPPRLVQILRVEVLDENGGSYEPPRITYWVCAADGNREVIERFADFQNALDFAAAKGYSLVGAPAP